MRKYFEYLKYVLIHKKNVFKICFRKGMFVHAFTHDLSKFHPVEFVSYAKRFYGNPSEQKNNSFGLGWLHHHLGSFLDFRKRIEILDLVRTIQMLGYIDCKDSKLVTLCREFDVEIDPHSSFSDIKAAREVYQKIMSHLKWE